MTYMDLIMEGCSIYQYWCVLRPEAFDWFEKIPLEPTMEEGMAFELHCLDLMVLL